MKLLVTNKSLSFIGGIILNLIFSYIAFSQENCKLCEGVNVCCDKGTPICYNDENPPRSTCLAPPNTELALSGNERDEKEFKAQFVSKLLGRKIGVEELENNKALQEGLKNGKIVVSNGETITFTPIGEIIKEIRENPDKYRSSQKDINKTEKDINKTEDKFIKRTELDGIKKAFEEYKENLGTPNSTPVRPNFFLSFGRELAQKNTIEDLQKAITIFQFDAEQNKSQEAQTELNLTQIKLADLSIQQNQIKNAKTILEKVRKDEKASQEIKREATQKLDQVKSREQ